MKGTTAIPIIALLNLIAATPAVAFGPEFCAIRYEAPRSDLGAGWRGLGIYFGDGCQLFRRMTNSEWSDCTCQPDQTCQCCSYDNELICREAKRINTTTANRLRIWNCPR